MIYCKYNIGDIVKVHDRIDPVDGLTVIATIKFIEPDKDFVGLNWLYLVANNEELNVTDFHPGIGSYWCILEDSSNLIELVSKPTF